MGPELHGPMPPLYAIVTFVVAAVGFLVACWALGARKDDGGTSHALAAMADLWKETRRESRELRRDTDELHRRLSRLEARGVRVDPGAEFPRGPGVYEVIVPRVDAEEVTPSGRTKLNAAPPPGAGAVVPPGPGTTLVSPGGEER